MSAVPEFLHPLAERLDATDGPCVPSGAEKILRPPLRAAVPHDGKEEERIPRSLQSIRESAVLITICGTTLEEAGILIEERSHTMRSQPAQFAFPGGRVDPEDANHVAAALREAREEVGLSPATHPQLHVLGAFMPIRMPVRPMLVTPVVAWHPSAPNSVLSTLELEPAEVERVIAPRITGPGSLTDPAVLKPAVARGSSVGIAFDLPLEADDPNDDAFVWGFTAALLGGVLPHVVPGFDTRVEGAAVEVPTSRLRGEHMAR